MQQVEIHIFGAKLVNELFNRNTDSVERAREISRTQGAELLIHGRSNGQFSSRG